MDSYSALCIFFMWCNRLSIAIHPLRLMLLKRSFLPSKHNEPHEMEEQLVWHEQQLAVERASERAQINLMNELFLGMLFEDVTHGVYEGRESDMQNLADRLLMHIDPSSSKYVSLILWALRRQLRMEVNAESCRFLIDILTNQAQD